MNDIGERIKELRIKGNISQEDLALKLNVSRQTVTKWEIGKAQPSVENISSLCELFGVSADYLISGATAQTETAATASAEITAEDTTADADDTAARAAQILTARKKRALMIVFAVVIGIAFSVCGFLTVMSGCIVFDGNTGAVVVGSGGINMPFFIIVLVFAVLTLAAEIVLLILLLKKEH